MTGGNGLLGRHIQRACAKHQLEVHAPTRQQLDLHNPADVIRVMTDVNPDVVIHSAGLVGSISDNIRRPYDYCFANLQIGLSVIDAARQIGVSRLVNISSANIYPDADNGESITEGSILSGALNKSTYGYGLAKGCIAKLIEFCNEQYGLIYRNFIPSNLYGEWDNFDPEHAHMIPAIMRRLHEAAKRGDPVVEIWGDGSARRAFLYAGDLAEYIVANLHHLARLPVHLNLAPEKDHSVLEYNQIIANVVGFRGEFHFNLDKPVGVATKRLDCSVAKQFDWKPKMDIREGIHALYQYFLSENL